MTEMSSEEDPELQVRTQPAIPCLGLAKPKQRIYPRGARVLTYGNRSYMLVSFEDTKFVVICHWHQYKVNTKPIDVQCSQSKFLKIKLIQVITLNWRRIEEERSFSFIYSCF